LHYTASGIITARLYIQDVQKLKKNNSGAKRLNTAYFYLFLVTSDIIRFVRDGHL